MSEDTVTVRVSQGNLRGKRTTTKSGSPFLSFTGVPYARPPVGPLRFKPPQCPEPWTGTCDALEFSPICLQEDFFGEVVGQEDCLYLNVYTPCIPLVGTVSSKPVMVWIHGGGFNMGSGNPDLYGADYLVDADVVVVTINYRVGIFGFLSLDNEAVPGNMGLKDQVAALLWVRKNISTFGGDPHNVTIFGESAGGASVQYLMMSPLSKGLFHKAIAQSGSSLNPWAFSLTNKARAFKVGEALGCKTSDPNMLLEFLMKEDGTKLIHEARKIFPQADFISNLRFPFVPTVEPELPGAFLSEHPLQALKTGHFHKVPFITGFTSHEGIFSLKGVKDKHWPQLNSKLCEPLPEKLDTNGNSVPPSTVNDRIRHFYFNNQPVSKERRSEFVDFQSDLNFIEGVYTTLKHTMMFSTAPVYLYKFSFDGALGLSKMFFGGIDMKGACHGDDLAYLFYCSLFNVDVEPSSPEMKTIKQMVSLWTNFAKYGNPTPVLQGVPVLWKPCTYSCIQYLSIDKDSRMSEFAEINRMKLWEEIYHCKL